MSIMPNGEPLLDRWANFYIATSAAAATLVGLLFVVITLGADRVRTADRARKDAEIKAYLTPVVVYFCSVLFLGALLTIPSHTALSAAVCICTAGMVGLIYSATRGIGGDRRGVYRQRSDFIPYVILPSAAYILIAGGGLWLCHTPQTGLVIVAAGILLLLGVAIRNSWALAITVAGSKPE